MNASLKSLVTLHLAVSVAVLACNSVQAQILVTTNGAGPFAFATQPPATQWSTRSIGGSSTDVTTAAGLDALVQANTTGLTTAQVGSLGGSPPATTNRAIWGTAGYLQTRPTSVQCIFLMATLRNNSGAAVSSVVFGYDLTAATAATE
ncbi:MAG TPA: hypothetical protein VGF13_13670, partial [Verrucomicrobiae bacterium]